MLLISSANVQATESRRQDLLAAAAAARLIASGETGPRRPGAVAGVLRGIAAALGRAAARIPDSRETLRSKEQDLAALGVIWGADPAGDRELARELLAARAQRQARRLPSPFGEPVGGLSTVHRAEVHRRAYDVAVAR